MVFNFSLLHFYCFLVLSTAQIHTLISQQEKTIQIISFEEFKELDHTAINLVDVRTLEEFNTGHIRGARHLDYLQIEQFKSNVTTMDRKVPIYVYCHSGGRSHQASLLLKEMGFNQIYNYSGGYLEWSQKK
ncbi:MAG: rhodanese-like domain-containing protein [Flavobacteriaceae bacterium]